MGRLPTILIAVLFATCGLFAQSQASGKMPPAAADGHLLLAQAQAQPRHAQPAQHPKAGEWLRKHRGQPLAQQQKELENNPGFRKLPPERQQKLQERLRQFNSMPPEQQQRVLNRMQRFEQLTPQQRQEARSLEQQMKTVPEDRRRAMRIAVRNLRQMAPAERQQTLNSNDFTSRFSDPERSLIQRVLALPIGPAPAASSNQPH